MYGEPTLFAELAINQDHVIVEELTKAVTSLKDGKACGPDLVPVEYWKAALKHGDGHASRRLVEICNACLREGTLPTAWHHHQTALVFKKGGPAECGNYRPICLLNSAYKIFTAILLRRLLATGADDRM